MWPAFAIFASSSLLLLIVRSSDIKSLCKKASQRTKLEQQLVDRGLLRSLLLELFLFVPASAGLLLLIAPLVVGQKLPDGPQSQVAVYALMGIASYGFPFATIRVAVTRMALNALKEFAAIAHEQEVAQEPATREES